MDRQKDGLGVVVDAGDIVRHVDPGRPGVIAAKDTRLSHCDVEASGIQSIADHIGDRPRRESAASDSRYESERCSGIGAAKKSQATAAGPAIVGRCQDDGAACRHAPKGLILDHASSEFRPSCAAIRRAQQTRLISSRGRKAARPADARDQRVPGGVGRIELEIADRQRRQEVGLRNPRG